jgi:cation diffusion facilitator family transporter
VAAVTATRLCHAGDEAPSTEAQERKVRVVVAITLFMMVAELAVGLASGSLALVADAWHMGCHAGAIGLTGLAYWFARTRARHAGFAFGTGKVPALTGFTNAVLLVGIAVVTIAEACKRFFAPVHVDLREALPVAVVGLVVNIVCAALLQHDHEAGEHAEHHGGAHPDHNLHAAYLHVLGDALVSIGAILALVGVRVLGWTRLDPIMACISSVVILRWGVDLCRITGRQLLDVSGPAELIARIRARLEQVGDARVSDLHLWELEADRVACVVSLVTSAPRPVAIYHAAVREVTRIEHLTVEIVSTRSPGSFGE